MCTNSSTFPQPPPVGLDQVFWPIHDCQAAAGVCTEHCRWPLTKLIEHAACQVTFGICGDYLGQKKIYLVTLILMIACTIGQCFAAAPFKGIG